MFFLFLIFKKNVSLFLYNYFCQIFIYFRGLLFLGFIDLFTVSLFSDSLTLALFNLSSFLKFAIKVIYFPLLLQQCFTYICHAIYFQSILNIWDSLVARMVKNLPAMQETWVQSLFREIPWRRNMVTHSSILAWEISWTEEPGGLQSMGLQRVGHN